MDSPLDATLDIFRIRQYFNAVTMARELAGGIRKDLSFVAAARRAVLPMPTGRRRAPRNPFPAIRRAPSQRLRSRRVALLSTGGSGALASVVGAARALEEAGVHVAVMSLCSGSALFGFPLAAGCSAEEVATKTLGLSSDELVDVDWPAVLRLIPRLGRGFTGVLRGDRIERWYRSWLGDITLGDLAIPAYAPVWDIERNRLEYIGPRTHPRLAVARAVRMAVALPLFIEAVEYRGHHYCDGGTADILPVHPLLDIESPPPDLVIAINGFYPPEFAGEDITGWVDRAGSIFYAASQVRVIQHMQLGRENLARLRREVADVRVVNPVPYDVIRGIGLYRQFFDNSGWPDFMRAGLRVTRRALAGDRSPMRGQPIRAKQDGGRVTRA